jgi:molybdopterin converting factor subunit 1
MKVRIKLFAVARQRTGQDTIDVELPASPTIHHLRAALIDQYPPLADVVPHARFALSSEYAPDSAAISPDSEIAIIPPVSGG